jgi:pyruvate/2-oxoglutarate dehydrogenase complex dihydrolipoamide dehydrogenase (E3) component
VSDITPAAKAVPLTPDICVIGAGAAGLSVATAAAAFGVSVVVVERAMMGGDRRGLACAALIEAGARAQAVRDAKRFGISAAEPEINYARVHDHIQRVLAANAPDHSAERLRALGATVIKGEARFINRNSVNVGEYRIKARRFVIATGSKPAMPAIPGLDSVACLTDESIVALTRLPERLIVLGGGARAVALAQAMRRLGSAVTVIEPAGLLAQADPEAVAIIRRKLLREGVVLHERMQALSLKSHRSNVRIVLADLEGSSQQTIEGTHLLVATGRIPEFAALDLELAGIASDARGVVVDKHLRTANRNVFAIGDCAGGMAADPDFPEAANDHASLVLRNALFRTPIRIDIAASPRVAPCRPALASIGLSEAAARKKAGEIRILRWPFSENDQAQAGRETDGFVKLVADRRGRLLGVTIVGEQANELIVPWCLALRKGLTVQDMAGLVMPYSSLSQASGRAAVSFHAPLAAKPGIRRLIGFLRRFG